MCLLPAVEEDHPLHRAALEFAKGALEPSSVSKYSYAANSYMAFCDRQSPPLPKADSRSVAAFIQYLSEHEYSASWMAGVVSSIRDLHRFDKAQTWPKDEIIKRALLAARKAAPAVKHRTPLTRADLERIGRKLSFVNKYHVRDMLLFLIGYRAFLRASELVALKNNATSGSKKSTHGI